MSELPPIIVPSTVPAEVDLPDYPSAGVGVITGCSSVTNVTAADYLRVNSYSVALLPNNTAMVAVASQAADLLSQPSIEGDSTYDEIELSKREASRVYVVGSLIDATAKTPSTVRNARVISSDATLKTVTLKVDAAIYAATEYQALWILDGQYKGKSLQVEERVSTDTFVCKFFNSDYEEMAEDVRFDFVAFSDTDNAAFSASFTSPLPYIEHNGFAIPAVNPQIATNADIFPAPETPYVYVVCQAPVDFTYQLFLFAFRAGTSPLTYGWKQLTYDGENRNPQIAVDSVGNLHITWESSRCSTETTVVENENITFAVIGDFGKDGANEASVANLVKSWNPDFIVTTGDNNYETGSAATMDANIGKYYHEYIGGYTGSYGDGASENRFFPALGNHDWGNYSSSGSVPNPAGVSYLSAYAAYFNQLPGNRRYYNFVRGAVEFFVLDSDKNEPDGTSPSSAQGVWLQAALAASTSRWKVVVFHHPAYSSSSSHGSSDWMQWNFNEWGVDLVLSGHDHVYERLSMNGVTYVTCGVGGRSLNGFTSSPLAASQKRLSVYGATRISASETTLSINFFNTSGVLQDQFTITKDAEPQVIDKSGFGVYYGVLGPASRAATNEAFVSVLDKQARSLQLSATINPTDDRDAAPPSDTRFSHPLIEVSDPTALDVRPQDEDGIHYGSAWTEWEGGSGNVVVTDAGTITVSGSPSDDLFMASALLARDENGNEFDGKFSQLSYQLSFRLKMDGSGVTVRSDNDIETLYRTFKSEFSPVSYLNGSVNVYSKDGKNYTISSLKKYGDKIVPVAGAYSLNGTTPTVDSRLKHFFLAAVPERVKFEATNVDDPTDVFETDYYTGKYRLSLFLSSSANMYDLSFAGESYRAVRNFGELYLGTQYDFKIAVHYSHLQSESALHRASMDLIDGTVQSVRFSGNVIVVIDGEVAAAESFSPAFDGVFHGFDICLGVPPGGVFPHSVPVGYEQNLYDDLTYTQYFTGIAIGPHSVREDPFLVNLAKYDRNVSRMVIKNVVSDQESASTPTETFLTDAEYWLSLGLLRNKVGLSQIPITFDGRNARPSISLDKCDRAHIAFQSNRDGRWQIYYTGVIDQSMPFRFDTKISDTHGDALSPSVAVDNNGRRIVVWHDDRSGRYQVYAARSLRPLPCRLGEGQIATARDLGDLYDDPYDPYDPYGYDICDVTFTFTNDTGIDDKFHFSISFYSNEETTELKTTASSADNIANWTADGEQLSYDGVSIAAGESVTVTYRPSGEDDVSGAMYYAKIAGITSTGSHDWPYVYAYYCPVEQKAACTVPCVYINSTGSPVTVHFRVSFYYDSARTKLVMSADSSSDLRKWTSGTGEFPTGGVTVGSLDTGSVFYNPEVLPPDLYYSQNKATTDALLCGATYYVKVESKEGSTYSELETFAYECDCGTVDSSSWRNDVDSKTWICSGQGGEDARLTASSGDALFPRVASSRDGIAYVVWEDHRHSKTTAEQKAVSPDIYYAAWDANDDKFYSSAQGSYDKRLTVYSDSSGERYYQPSVVVGHFENPTFFFQTRNDVFRRNCSLYRESEESEETLDAPTGSGVFTDDFDLAVTQADANKCLSISLVKDDIVDSYHRDGETPVHLVKACLVRLDVAGPPGTYAVRFRNEDETKWSDWLSILPQLPDHPERDQYAIRGDGSMRDNFEAFFIGADRFIAPWVLSKGSGNKTVYVEVLTSMGKSPPISIDLIARYDELRYKVEFFSDSAMETPVPYFNGYPVISTTRLKPLASGDGSSSSVSDIVVTNDVSSIEREVESISTIYIKVTFLDPGGLERMIELAETQKFASIFSPSDNPSVTFNLLQQGVNAEYGLPLTKLSSGVYSGSFAISKSDGVLNKDGLAVVIVNVPNQCTKVFTPEFAFESLDAYNVNLPGAGDFEGAYSLVPQETPESIRTRQRVGVAAREITLEQFRYKYTNNLSCTFMGNSCVEGAPPSDDYDDEVVEPDDFTSPLVCTKFNWTSPDGKEPFYYLDDSNLGAWVRYSPDAYIDFSDTRALSLGFGAASSLAGVLIMIKPSETITVTGGATAGSSVSFTIPANSVIFKNTTGFFCGSASPYRRATAQKTFTSSPASATIPAGTTLNNGTRDVEDTFTGSWYVRSFAEGVPRSILQSKGFLTDSGIFRAKFVHIVSGTGHCEIRDCSCSADCN